ncbi:MULTISPECIES: TonB-dependent receptor [Dysgonomonas]|uniref:TonB-dependent receptor n=1 Tax=Dysgonomonas TaxID=156973 RepID=UPI000929C8E2|nr:MULTISPECIES: TonB-dependent receptor [Dysgonomonas]MBN9301043.1 TonB-dependent receptor [Dysgonomonas mossii]OJX58177.1 MAG: ferrichrome-iron receptor [Dysgonomonas sp. 37-18]
MKKIITLFLFLIIGITIASAQVIKGRVLDENGDPIASATVAIKELQKGVSTDESGKFRFTNLPKRELTLVVSFVGYNNNEKKVDLKNNEEFHIQFDMISNANLSEIEVFGERYKQPEKLDAITRMPLRPSEQIQSISVISDKVIAEQGALTITDAVRNVPGVTLFGSYGGVKESMSLRGFRGIPVLKNGVRTDSQFQTASIQTDMMGVESIQVIKGSAAITQGVITDLGNAGGVINVVTKTPKFVNGGEVGVRVGSWGQVRPTFDVQTVLDSKNTIAFRLNGAYERADNYRAIVSSNKVYINPSLEWRPDDKTTVTLELDYMNENRTPVTSTVNLAGADKEALYDMPYSKFLGFREDNTNSKTLSYAARINRQLADKISLRAAYFNSSYNVDNTSTGLSALKSRPTDYNIKQRAISRNLRDDKNSTFQLDFVGKDVYTGSIKHTFQVGFDYRIADATTTNLGSMVVDTIDVLANKILNDVPSKLALKGAGDPVQAKYTTYGIMAQEVMTINEYLKVILGLRYSSISTINATAGTTTGDAWNPMLGLMVTPIKNVNIFGSYTTSTSLRSAAQILTDSVTQAGPSTTKQWEVGFKSDWLDNRLRFNFTYFNIKTENLTNAAYIEGTNTPTNYYYKAGTLKRDGIEVELNGRILNNLQIMLGYAYLNARYTDSPSYVNGSAPMNAPKHTANGWIYYTVDRGAVKGLSIGVGTYYVGKRPVNEYSLAPDGHGSPIGVKPFDMPAYTTVNAQVAYTYKKVTARVFFNNIFDELGYNSYFRGGYINQIDPRNFAGVVSYRF